MQNNQTTTNQNYLQNDWSFLPMFFSGFAGIAIGIAIGNALGWI